MEKIIGQLSPAEYWEYRTQVEEMNHKDSLLKLSISELKLLEATVKEHKLLSEIAQLRVSLHRNIIVGQKQVEYTQSKTEYTTFRDNLGVRLGHPLEGCIISDIDFSVSVFENETQEESLPEPK